MNLRGEFSYFVKTYGFPYMLIMDYQIDFSLSIYNDPDKRKLVRTFLLAFTLLANSKGFENATANIVFIINILLALRTFEYFLISFFENSPYSLNPSRVSPIPKRNNPSPIFDITFSLRNKS